MRIKPLHDWLVVKLDPFEEKRSWGILLEDSTANTVLTGIAVSVGPGRVLPTGERARPEVEVGERVAFFRWHLEHKTGKQLTSLLQETAEDLAMIRSWDVLFVIPRGEKVRFG